MRGEETPNSNDRREKALQGTRAGLLLASILGGVVVPCWVAMDTVYRNETRLLANSQGLGEGGAARRADARETAIEEERSERDSSGSGETSSLSSLRKCSPSDLAAVPSGYEASFPQASPDVSPALERWVSSMAWHWRWHWTPNSVRYAARRALTATEEGREQMGDVASSAPLTKTLNAAFASAEGVLLALVILGALTLAFSVSYKLIGLLCSHREFQGLSPVPPAPVGIVVEPQKRRNGESDGQSSCDERGDDWVKTAIQRYLDSPACLKRFGSRLVVEPSEAEASEVEGIVADSTLRRRGSVKGARFYSIKEEAEDSEGTSGAPADVGSGDHEDVGDEPVQERYTVRLQWLQALGAGHESRSVPGPLPSLVSACELAESVAACVRGRFEPVPDEIRTVVAQRAETALRQVSPVERRISLRSQLRGALRNDLLFRDAEDVTVEACSKGLIRHEGLVTYVPKVLEKALLNEVRGRDAESEEADRRWITVRRIAVFLVVGIGTLAVWSHLSLGPWVSKAFPSVAVLIAGFMGRESIGALIHRILPGASR